MRKGIIDIQGKEYPCRLTMGALVEMKRLSGVDLSKGNVSFDYELMAQLLYCCVKSSCRADSVELPYKSDIELADVIEPEDFVKWQQVNMPMSVAGANETKKKRP